MIQKDVFQHTVYRIAKENIAYAVMGFMFAALEMYITSLSYFFPIYRWFLIYGIGPIFFMFLMLELIFHKRKTKRISWILIGSLLAICICGITVSVIGGDTTVHSITRLLACTISLLTIPIFFTVLGPNLPLAAVKGISLYCRITLILYLFSVIVFRKTGMYIPKGSDGARYHYFWGHVNSSIKLALPALVIFAVVDIWCRGKIRISTWVLTLLTLAAQFYTASYVAAVGMCIYTLILFVFSRENQLANSFVKWLPLAVSGLIFVFIVLTRRLAFQSIVKFGTQFNRSGSILSRGLIWNMGLATIENNKYGYGLFCDYSHLIRIGNYFPSSAHNLFLDVTIQTGIFGAILFIILLFLLMKGMPSWGRWPVIPAALFAYAVMWNFEPYFVDLYLQCTLLVIFLMFCLPVEINADLIKGGR